MGEYAIRKSDNVEVKIGTCESMYYLRFDQKHLVKPTPGSLNPESAQGLFWRLPFPDEDNVQIGEYVKYNRGYRLFKSGEKYAEDFSDASTIENPGTMQFHNDSGLLVNVKCYHGEKLPESTGDVKMFWNGKSWFYELTSIKNTADGVVPVVSCRHCGQMWRYSWAEILPFIHDTEMRERLAVYANEITD